MTVRLEIGKYNVLVLPSDKIYGVGTLISYEDIDALIQELRKARQDRINVLQDEINLHNAAITGACKADEKS